MAFIRCTFFSEVLKQHTYITLAMPDAGTKRTTWPVLYLLHGGTENSTTWFREVNVEGIANQYGVLAISFDAMSSSYADMVHGGKYFTFYTQELPRILSARFSVQTERENTYIAGFSMGGQGALKAALQYPERYGACIAISGARDVIKLFECWQKMEDGPDLSGVIDALGPIEQLRGGPHDIVALAEKFAHGEWNGRTRLYLSCGREDYAALLSKQYHEQLQEMGLVHDWYVSSGNHSYAFGEKALRHALDDLMRGTNV